jgi:2-polyprenyl-3-methyl-5-hydroxy-6-metoxy-1,4-benzoquinol methylase
MEDAPMDRRALEWLVCPRCGAALERWRSAEGEDTEAAIVDGSLVCRGKHAFPVEDGLPRLIVDAQLESRDSRSIRESFSRQWQHFDYEEEDRTWGQTLEFRVQDFLRMVELRPDELKGKRVLDAGCGNGLLSDAITRFGCDVLAADISTSVVSVHRRFRTNPRLTVVQADLMVPPFRPGAFDLVFCAGVLIVTPDSRTTFREVAKAVAPGGRLFVWLYWKEAKPLYRLKVGLRRLVAPLPLTARRAVAYAFVPQALLRQWLRRRLGAGRGENDLHWREHFVVQHDFWTPRYRWEHTPEEVYGWFRELGFVDMKMTEAGPSGFGVLATLPAAVAEQGAATPAMTRTRVAP